MNRTSKMNAIYLVTYNPGKSRYPRYLLSAIIHNRCLVIGWRRRVRRNHITEKCQMEPGRTSRSLVWRFEDS